MSTLPIRRREDARRRERSSRDTQARRNCGGAAQHCEVDNGCHCRVRHDVDEVAGIEQAALGMFPSREALVADELVRAKIDDRLHVRADESVAHCNRELVGDRADAQARVAVEDDDLAHPAGLRLVHRGVGGVRSSSG